MAAVGQGSLGTIPFAAPSWARAFTAVGLEVASQANRGDGELAPVAILSVPTGQFAAWLLAAGALGARPKLSPIETIGEFVCTTWIEDIDQIGDTNVSVQLRDGQLIHRVGRTLYTKGLPVFQHHLSPPDERGHHRNLSRLEAQRIRKAIQPLMPKTENWYIWWTRQCLSPAIIIGDGGDYLLHQKTEILLKQPTWFWETSRTLLSLEMKRVREINRLLQFPFAVISPRAAASSPWARSIRPRIVIYTSWSAYTRRRADTFAGCPTVVLVNRRVSSSLRCRTDLSKEFEKGSRLMSPLTSLPKGIAMHVVDFPVTTLVEDPLTDDEEADNE